MARNLAGVLAVVTLLSGFAADAQTRKAKTCQKIHMKEAAFYKDDRCPPGGLPTPECMGYGFYFTLADEESRYVSANGKLKVMLYVQSPMMGNYNCPDGSQRTCNVLVEKEMKKSDFEKGLLGQGALEHSATFHSEHVSWTDYSKRGNQVSVLSESTRQMIYLQVEFTDQCGETVGLEKIPVKVGF